MYKSTPRTFRRRKATAVDKITLRADIGRVRRELPDELPYARFRQDLAEIQHYHVSVSRNI